MKKFTLRLTDIEAEALERLAYMKGESQNRVVVKAIADMYEDLDGDAIFLDNGTIQSIARLFCGGVISAQEERDNKAITTAHILRACSYDLEHDPDAHEEEYIHEVQEEPSRFIFA